MSDDASMNPAGSPIARFLSPEDLTATEEALRPLATLARKIRKFVWTGILLCSAAFVTLSMVVALVDASALVMIATLGTGFGAIALGWYHRSIWQGTLSLFGRPIELPGLPAAAAGLFEQLRRGDVVVCYAPDARPFSSYLILPKVEVQGPFGPLLLSSDPAHTGLAMWSLFGGDKFTVLFRPMRSVLPSKPAAPEHAADTQLGDAARGAAGCTHPVVFWPRDRFETLIRLATDKGLKPHHAEYLLWANELALSSGRNAYPAPELDRAVAVALKDFGPQWNVTWGAKVLRADYAAVWDILFPVIAQLERESREFPGIPEEPLAG